MMICMWDSCVRLTWNSLICLIDCDLQDWLVGFMMDCMRDSCIRLPWSSLISLHDCILRYWFVVIMIVFGKPARRNSF